MRNHLEKKCRKVPKSAVFYNCEICDYTTSHKSHYDKHLATKKHKKKCNQNVTFCNMQKVPFLKTTNEKLFPCTICGKVYKSRMGLRLVTQCVVCKPLRNKDLIIGMVFLLNSS